MPLLTSFPEDHESLYNRQQASALRVGGGRHGVSEARYLLNHFDPTVVGFGIAGHGECLGVDNEDVADIITFIRREG